MFRNSKWWVAGLWLLLNGGQVLAQEDPRAEQFRAFEDVFVERGELADSVRNRVLYFVNFGCPFCEAAHPHLSRWSNSLPPPYEFEVIPAVAIRDHMPMAIAYYAVLAAAPDRIEAFEVALYRQLAGQGRSTWDPSVYRSAAISVGVSEEEFNALAASPLVERYVERAYQLTTLLGVDEVPTIVVGNRYRTTPGRVQNDHATFIGLLNGLVSMHHAEFVR